VPKNLPAIAITASGDSWVRWKYFTPQSSW
jgi:hypothetical protein